jgi:BASS family bile acid:Na+ symporter
MTVEQVLTALFNAGVAVSIIATVLSLGMSFTPAQVLAPLRRVWLVVGMVILNAAIIPAIAWGVARLFPLSDATVAGLTLTTLGAGSAAGLKATQLAKRADLPLAVALVVVLQLVNLVAVPLWAGRVVTGASISAGEIVKNLLVLVLIPLVVGLFIRACYAENATRWQPEFVRVANLALGIAVVALGLGMLMGGKIAPHARQLGGNPAYLGQAIYFALINLLIPLAVVTEPGRRASAAAVSAVRGL